MRKRRPSDLVHLQVRMTEAFRVELANAAEKSERSLNSEILWRLSQTFGEEWQRYIAGIEKAEHEADELRKKIVDSPKFKTFIEEFLAKQAKESGDAS
jgi:Arc-like DNA binding domain